MYLRLEIDGEEKFYSFPDKKRVAIGGAPTCDIQLKADGIDRYHLEIHEKMDGEFYAVDKGSTHGTFINEQKLAKDSPVAFNTFFPALLGESVYVYLMDDPVVEDSSPELPSENSHHVSSLDNFFKEEQEEKKTKPVPTISKEEPSKPATKKKPQIHVPSTAGQMTKDMQKLLDKQKELDAANKVSKKKARKKAASPKRKKKSTQDKYKLYMIIAIILFVGLLGYKQWQKIEQRKLDKIAEEKRRKKALELELIREKQLEEQKKLERKKKEEERKKRMQVKEYVHQDKCLSDLERSYCTPLQNGVNRLYKEGAYQELSTLYVVIDPAGPAAKYENYEYTKEQIPVVIKEAKRELGRIFHPGRFTKLMKMKLKGPEKTADNLKALALADFILAYQDGLPPADGIDKVVIIAMRNDLYEGHLDLSMEKLKKANLKDHVLLALMAYRSNILVPMKALFQRYRYEPKKEQDIQP